MNNLNFNIPVIIFIAGAILFLLAPLGVFQSFNSNEIYIAALFIESIGVTTALLVYHRDKLFDVYVEEI